MENEKTSPIKNPFNFLKNIKADKSKIKFILAAIVLLFLLVIRLFQTNQSFESPIFNKGVDITSRCRYGQNNDKINIDDIPQQILSSNLLLLTQDGTLSYTTL